MKKCRVRTRFPGLFTDVPINLRAPVRVPLALPVELNVHIHAILKPVVSVVRLPAVPISVHGLPLDEYKRICF